MGQGVGVDGDEGDEEEDKAGKESLVRCRGAKRAQHSQSNVLGRSFPPGVLERNALSQNGYFSSGVLGFDCGVSTLGSSTL